MSAKIITFEGIDGAGKSTLIDRLNAHYDEAGLVVWTTSEPFDLNCLARIQAGLDDDPFVATLHLMVDRRNHCKRIREQLDEYDLILIDRFDLSTEAYQGYGDGVNREMIWILNAEATEGIIPAMRILLNVPLNVGVQRLIDRGDSPSVDEIVRLERVRQGYGIMARHDRLRDIDASQPADDVFRDAVRLIEEVL